MEASAERTQALTERTLALVPRAKYPHCSARARDGLDSLPPLHSLTHLLHRFRRSLPLISKSSKLTRPSMKTAGAPKLQTAKTSSLRSSRGSNLHCVPVLADRARAWRLKQNGRATSSGQKIISPRCFARARHQQYGARRCLSPKAKALASRGFARCKTSALSVRPTSFWSLR